MNESKKTNYLGGAALLAGTVALTKVIGAIYKIPLYNLLSDEGVAHFSVTYNIYTLLLTLSTAGIPVALSRLISASHAKGNDSQVKRYFRVALMAFLLIGAIGTGVMLFFPGQLAAFMGDPEAALGVRCLAPSVILVCVISVYRGYAQGHGNMVPTAISQVLEVLCKLIVGIAIAWYLSSLSFGQAVVSAGAVTGVTVGLAITVPILFFYKRKMDRGLYSQPEERLGNAMSASQTLGTIFKVSIPIALGSSVLNIITFIDTKLVLMRLQDAAGFSTEDANILYGVYSKALTLFNMPSAFIVPVTVSVVPAIAAAIARRQHGESRLIIESSLKVTTLFALPAAVGLSVLSEPIFAVLYPDSHDVGPAILTVLGLASFFVCTYLMTNAILQATGHEKLALLTLPIGGVVKIAINWVLVGAPEINIMGAPIGTIVCYAFITLMNLVFIWWKVPEKPNFLKVVFRPALCTGVMGACAWGVYGLCSRFVLPHMGGRMGIVLCLACTIVLSVIVYGVLAILLRAITREDMRLVPKGEKLAKLLKIR